MNDRLGKITQLAVVRCLTIRRSPPHLFGYVGFLVHLKLFWCLNLVFLVQLSSVICERRFQFQNFPKCWFVYVHICICMQRANFTCCGRKLPEDCLTLGCLWHWSTTCAGSVFIFFLILTVDQHPLSNCVQRERQPSISNCLDVLIKIRLLCVLSKQLFCWSKHIKSLNCWGFFCLWEPHLRYVDPLIWTHERCDNYI